MSDTPTSYCLNCGSKLTIKTSDDYHCPCCGRNFNKEQLDAFLMGLKDKSDAVSAAELRANLWKTVHAEYLSSEDIVQCCNDILTFRAGSLYPPDAKKAKLYPLVFRSPRNNKEINAYIRDLVKEEFLFADEVAEFMVRTLEVGNYDAVSALIGITDGKHKKLESLFRDKKCELDNGAQNVNKPRNVFISYDSLDTEKAKELVEFLESHECGYTCFISYRNLPNSYENFWSNIFKAIDNCDVFLFVSSKSSRDHNSGAMTEMSYLMNHYIDAGVDKPRVEYLVDAYSPKPYTSDERAVNRCFGDRGYTWYDKKTDVADRIRDLLGKIKLSRTGGGDEFSRVLSINKICLNCGRENPQDFIYCGICGKTDFVTSAFEYASIKKQKELEEEIERLKLEKDGEIERLRQENARIVHESEERFERLKSEYDRVKHAVLAKQYAPSYDGDDGGDISALFDKQADGETDYRMLIKQLKVYARKDISAADVKEYADKLSLVIKQWVSRSTEIGDIRVAPNFIRFYLMVPNDVSVKKIANAQSDIEYRIGIIGARVVAEASKVGGKPEYYIDIPRTDRSVVGLREVIEAPEFKSRSTELAAPLGVGVHGARFIDIEKAPHILIAGQTGSGKSAFLHSLLIGLMHRASPRDLRFILIDPKRVEFSVYENMPHLLTGKVYSDSTTAFAAIQWVNGEIERRYDLFKEVGALDISEYNAFIGNDSSKAALPRIVVVVDELADLIVSNHKRAFEDFIMQSLRLARSAGIHLVLATQRPSVDVISGVIKANISCRIAFRMTSSIDSRVVLDEPGAETLYGNGDLLYKSLRSKNIERVQGCYIDTQEIENTVSVLANMYSRYGFDSSADKQIRELAEYYCAGDSGESVPSEIVGYSDKLFPMAVACAVTQGSISISFLQRKLSIGYASAMRMIDRMEDLGFIGSSHGSSPHETYLNKECFKQIFGMDAEELLD